jgi:hypothetical protein
LGAKTGLNDGVFVNNLTRRVPNGKCKFKRYLGYQIQPTTRPTGAKLHWRDKFQLGR